MVAMATATKDSLDMDIKVRKSSMNRLFGVCLESFRLCGFLKACYIEPNGDLPILMHLML